MSVTRTIAAPEEIHRSRTGKQWRKHERTTPVPDRLVIHGQTVPRKGDTIPVSDTPAPHMLAQCRNCGAPMFSRIGLCPVCDAEAVKIGREILSRRGLIIIWRPETPKTLTDKIIGIFIKEVPDV